MDELPPQSLPLPEPPPLVPEVATVEPADAPGLSALGGPTPELIRELLTSVIDPELGIDIVNLGLLRSVEIDGDVARVRFTVTTPACPLSSYIEDEIRSCLWQIQGLGDVDVACEMSPLWKPEDMTDVARASLGW